MVADCWIFSSWLFAIDYDLLAAILCTSFWGSSVYVASICFLLSAFCFLLSAVWWLLGTLGKFSSGFVGLGMLSMALYCFHSRKKSPDPRAR